MSPQYSPVLFDWHKTTSCAPTVFSFEPVWLNSYLDLYTSPWTYACRQTLAHVHYVAFWPRITIINNTCTFLCWKVYSSFILFCTLCMPTQVFVQLEECRRARVVPLMDNTICRRGVMEFNAPSLDIVYVFVCTNGSKKGSSREKGYHHMQRRSLLCICAPYYGCE
jgi:hypothetical protein